MLGGSSQVLHPYPQGWILEALGVFVTVIPLGYERLALSNHILSPATLDQGRDTC